MMSRLTGAVLVRASDYTDATESYIGWCTTCERFTRDSTEPDAHDYECPACGDLTVMGAEDALCQGFIELEEEE
jgi:Zn finger protein HypA/HybF involved in hydrogenase expression